MIDVPSAHLQIILDILKTHVPDCEVRAFGSRYTWTAKDHSDLDLAVVGTEKLSRKTLAALQTAFEESDLPYRVDVLDWRAISPEFQTVIEQGYEVIQDPKGLKRPLGSTNGWQEYPFTEVIDFQEGPGILAKDFRDSGVPLVRLAGLDKGVSLLDGCNYLDPELVERRYSHFKIKEGDILLSTSASLGRTAVVDKKSEGAIVYTGIIRMRPANDKLFAPFIKFLLEAPNFQQQIEAMGAGSVIRHFGPYHLKQMTVIVPSLPTQHRIVDILSALDDKIELNRQTNATLEAIAQAIFKEWFVDFNFPVLNYDLNDSMKTMRAGSENHSPSGNQENHSADMVASELGMIPRGWRVGKIEDLVNVQSGFAFKSELFENAGKYKVITIKNVQDGLFDNSKTDYITEIPDKMPDYCRLQEGDILLSLTGNVGRVCFVYGDNHLLNQRVAKLHPINNSDIGFVYTLFRTQEIKRSLISLGKGTAQQNLSPIETKQMTIVIPSRGILHHFADATNSLYEKYIENLMETQILAQLRDNLLQKLMSGEINV